MARPAVAHHQQRAGGQHLLALRPRQNIHTNQTHDQQRDQSPSQKVRRIRIFRKKIEQPFFTYYYT